MKYRNWHGFIVLEDLDLPEGGGVKVLHLNKDGWEYASIFPNLEEETLFEANDMQSWSHATAFFGNATGCLIRENRVYWNYVVTFSGIPAERHQKLRIIRYAAGGRPLSQEDLEVEIIPEGTHILCNWSEWQGAPIHRYGKMPDKWSTDPKDAENGWTIASSSIAGQPRFTLCGKDLEPRLTILGKDRVPPLSYCPGISGRFDLYVCVRDDCLECSLELPGQKLPEQILIQPCMIPAQKLWKEVYIGQYAFTSKDEIRICQAEPTLHNPIRHFGDLFYIKLVPAERKPQKSPCARKMGEIAFYTEPYTLAYFHQLLTAEQADRIFEQYTTFGVDRIISQMGRVGSFVLYPSKVAKRDRGGQLIGDDKQSSTGPEIAMRQIDMLKVCSEACHRHGMKYYANLSINHPMAGTTMESTFTAEHPEYLWKGLLNFAFPEVVDYATEHFLEMSRYDIDGLSIQHTRYPYHQTKETLLAFQRQLVEKLGSKRRSELEIEMSFVANDPDYYEAIEQMLKEDLIDVITPGNLMCIYPKIELAPFAELAHRYGKRVFGLVDAWCPSPADRMVRPLPRPAQFEEICAGHLAEGADGLYFYQSEYILTSPFHKRFVRSLK